MRKMKEWGEWCRRRCDVATNAGWLAGWLAEGRLQLCWLLLVAVDGWMDDGFSWFVGRWSLVVGRWLVGCWSFVLRCCSLVVVLSDCFVAFGACADLLRSMVCFCSVYMRTISTTGAPMVPNTHAHSHTHPGLRPQPWIGRSPRHNQPTPHSSQTATQHKLQATTGRAGRRRCDESTKVTNVQTRQKPTTTSEQSIHRSSKAKKQKYERHATGWLWC